MKKQITNLIKETLEKNGYKVENDINEDFLVTNQAGESVHMAIRKGLISTSPILKPEIVRRYLKAAIEKRQSFFEIKDNELNPDSLRNTAHKVVGSWFNQKVFFKAKHNVEAKMGKEIEWTSKFNELYHDCWTVYRKTIDDEIHVYCNINFDLIDKLEEKIYEIALHKEDEANDKSAQS